MTMLADQSVFTNMPDNTRGAVAVIIGIVLVLFLIAISRGK